MQIMLGEDKNVKNKKNEIVEERCDKKVNIFDATFLN